MTSMKIILSFGCFFFSLVSLSQNLYFGALNTNRTAYNNVGKAPSPIGSNIEKVVDLSPYMPPVGNQGNQNSCVAWAVAYANYSYLNMKSNICNYTFNGAINDECLFSPSFIYNQINDGGNNGTNFLRAFEVMRTQGVAPLSSMPYDERNWWHQPTVQARAIAGNHKITSYWQLGTSGEDFFLETKAYLSQGIPVIVSVLVDNYIKRRQEFTNPYIWSILSGSIEDMCHAILITGYDDNTQLFKFINSYGTNWGNSGYGFITYNIFRNVVKEAYIIKPQNENSPNEYLLSTEEKELSQYDINNGIYFNVENVIHHQFPAGYIPTPQEFYSSSMIFKSNIRIPRGVGQTFQVAVYFYYNVNGFKGDHVRSLNPYSRTLAGQAVAGTPIISLNPNSDFNGEFNVLFRYADFQIPRGIPPYQLIQTLMIAEPVLLIDNFPVRIGNTYPFFVNM